MLLIYLDQKDYSFLLKNDFREHRRWLSAKVRDGTLLAPVSLVHLVETAKAKREIRRPLLALIQELSGEVGVRFLLHDLEKEAKGITYVRKNMLVKSGGDMLGAPHLHLPLSEVFALWSEDYSSVEVHRVVEEAWAQKAAELNSQGPILLEHAFTSIMGRPCTRGEAIELRPVLRSGALQHALFEEVRRRVPRGLEGHDVGDVIALAQVLPYFDFVGCDRRMYARIAQACQGDSVLQEHAHVEKNLDRLVSKIKERLA